MDNLVINPDELWELNDAFLCATKNAVVEDILRNAQQPTADGRLSLGRSTAIALSKHGEVLASLRSRYSAYPDANPEGRRRCPLCHSEGMGPIEGRGYSYEGLIDHILGVHRCKYPCRVWHGFVILTKLIQPELRILQERIRLQEIQPTRCGGRRRSASRD